MEPDDIQRLITAGEGQHTEFKESFQKQVLETLCAFANAEGGVVLVGVKDDGSLSGVNVGGRRIEGFSNDLRQGADLPHAPSVEQLVIDGTNVVAVRIEGHQKGELATAYGKALIRIGKSNQHMTSTQMKGHLREDVIDWSEDRDRPRFSVRMSGANRTEAEYAPGFHMKQISGDSVRTLEWRLRGPRFQGMDWRVADASSLQLATFAARFNLGVLPSSDDRVGIDEMGFEIRTTWRGKLRHELHRWPIARREAAGKILWDAKEAILPAIEWDQLTGEEESLSSPNPVLLEALPPTHDNHIQLTLRNNVAAQNFVVDVLEFEGIEEPQQRYVMKWRGHDSEERTLYQGRDAVLDIAQVFPPEEYAGGTTRRGSFRLFSTSLPTGWEVHAGKSGWIDIREALDPVSSISLMLRITGSLGVSVRKIVSLGFNEPYHGQEPVWITIDDWLGA